MNLKDFFPEMTLSTVICDNCGAVRGAPNSIKTVEQIAFKEGWHLRVRKADGAEWLEFYCPVCAPEFK